MTKVTVAIIILNWKQPQLTLETISSVKKTKHYNFEFKIVLVDNCSPDDSWTIFNQQYKNDPQVILLKTSHNSGYVGGNNFGINYCSKFNYDYYLLLNNDVIVDPSFLQNMISYALDNPNTGLIAPKIYFAKGFEYHKKNYKKTDLGNVIWFAGGVIDWNNIYCSHKGIDEVDHGQYDQISQPDYLTGCCLFINSKLINKIGLLDENYYLYLEDADYSIRTSKSNFTLTYLPTSRIWHKNSGSSGAGSDLHHYFLTRNRLLFGYKYASLRTKFALFKQSLFQYFSTPLIWQKKGIIDYYLNKLGKGSWQ